MRKIKAVLFDSGMVLTFPASGHWFITPNFWEHISRERFSRIDSAEVKYAFSAATDYINSQKYIAEKDEEYRHFVKFYEIFLSELPELETPPFTAAHLAHSLVFDTAKYSFYSDALRVIPRLSEKYKLGIVSDAWPSLLDVYEANKMTAYFGVFVVSSFLGTAKPDKNMYAAALRELSVLPEEAIFIDDDPTNCIGAAKVGINAVLLCRNKREYLAAKLKSVGKPYKVINSLYELEKSFEL